MSARVLLFGLRQGEFASTLAASIAAAGSLEVIEQGDVLLSREPFSSNFTNQDTIVARFVHRPPHAQHEPTLVAFFQREEWANLIYGLAHTLGPDLFYNEPGKARIANSKPAQLEVARSVGLKTPRTLITNNTKKARQFVTDLGKPSIVKPVDCSVAPNPAKVNDSLLLYTREIEAGELDAENEGEPGSPAIFQERVDKDRELRVVVHGQEAIAVAIDSQRHPNSSLDWRRRLGDDSMYAYEEIDSGLVARLAAYLSCFGLHSGVFDLAINRDGHPIFFECNPNGQWYDMDKALGGKMMDLTARSIAAYATARKDRARIILPLAL